MKLSQSLRDFAGGRAEVASLTLIYLGRLCRAMTRRGRKLKGRGGGNKRDELRPSFPAGQISLNLRDQGK